LPGFANAAIAAGHFREGLHLSPTTASLISRLLAGQSADIPRECSPEFVCRSRSVDDPFNL
jgi:glycine oxidase